MAFSSTYFDRYFFDDNYAKPENIELNPTTTVEDFKRMVATLPPEQRRLDGNIFFLILLNPFKDNCIEAVLILADRFFMDNVMELCRNFLIHESRKPKLFIYRMAHKYRWNGTKVNL